MVCLGQALAKSKAAENRMLLDCFETRGGSVCGVVSYCVVGGKTNEVVRVLGLIGADDLCQG